MIIPSFVKAGLASAVTGRSSTLGFGCMGITAFYGDAPLPDDKAMELLKGVWDGGCRHFDTAEVYRTGDIYNEAVLGKFFQTVPRESFTIATKYWPYNHEGKCDYSSVKAALTASLERLGLDYVDLYYCHRITDLDGAIEFAKAGQRLKEEGLIQAVGLSEIGPNWLKKVHEQAGPIDAIQQEWSLMTRDLEDELVPMCNELGIVVVAYSPLARNLLAAKIEKTPTDWRATNPRYAQENLEANHKVLEALQQLSIKYNYATPAQLALAWLFKKADATGITVVPIPGTTKLERARSNMESAKIVIDDQDMKHLEGLVDMVAGARGTETYVTMGFNAKN